MENSLSSLLICSSLLQLCWNPGCERAHLCHLPVFWSVFSPLHLDSALNTLPLWVAYNKLLIYDQAIKNRKFKSIRKDGFYFGKGPNPINFLFFLSGTKWAWFFILDRLQTGARYIFHPRTTGVCLSLFIPEPHQLVSVHSVQLVSHPADCGQGCSLELWVSGLEPRPWQVCHPSKCLHVLLVQNSL